MKTSKINKDCFAIMSSTTKQQRITCVSLQSVHFPPLFGVQYALPRDQLSIFHRNLRGNGILVFSFHPILRKLEWWTNAPSFPYFTACYLFAFFMESSVIFSLEISLLLSVACRFPLPFKFTNKRGRDFSFEDFIFIYFYLSSSHQIAFNKLAGKLFTISRTKHRFSVGSEVGKFT